MLIGGLEKCSLIDYPGKVSAIVFTQGCNFRCGYCHNPELIFSNQFQNPIPQEKIFEFLGKREGKLDGVVITGGEPTLQPDILDFVKKVKDLGYLVKLDTNGSNPELLRKVIDGDLVDYLAMDIKAPLEKYHEIINAMVDISAIEESISLLKNFSKEYEFRTTVVENQLVEDDFIKIGELLRGSKLYFLQKFIPTKTLDPLLLDCGSYSDLEFERFREVLLHYIKEVNIR